MRRRSEITPGTKIKHFGLVIGFGHFFLGFDPGHLAFCAVFSVAMIIIDAFGPVCRVSYVLSEQLRGESNSVLA
jgi:hypothetical protein